MSTADDVWKEYLQDAVDGMRDGEVLHDVPRIRHAFMAGYRRALEDAADAIPTHATQELYGWDMAMDRAAEICLQMAAGVGTKDGDDERTNDE